MRFTSPIFCTLALLLIPQTVTADWLDDIGWRALRDQLGGTVEDGSNIGVSQVEAPIGSGAYMPNPNHNQFAGKTFINASGGNNAVSGHATNVGRICYGITAGIGRGINPITNYEANHWIDTVLNFQTGGDPAPQPFQVQNHSWIANGLGVSVATEALLRFDYIVNQNNITMVGGSSNGFASPLPELWGHCYNGIVVGNANGGHGHGATSFYGSGRYKPDIVCPQTSLSFVTSYSTAVISSGAAILREAGGGANGNLTNATQNETVKALLLAGATKDQFTGWDRTTTRPLDEQYGVGQFNILHSYNILDGGEFDGTPSSPGVLAALKGWDYSPSIASEKYYSFDVPNGATDVSIILTWNLDVIDLNPSPSAFVGSGLLADMNLELTDASGDTVDSSVSAVDNIEHIYIASLPPGQYTLRVDSDTDFDFALAWRMTANPEPTVVLPDTFNPSGVVLNGGLSSLHESDNQKLVVATGSSSQTVDVKGISPTENPTVFSFTSETSVRSARPVEQKIFLFNYDTDDWELVDTRLARVLGDEVVTIQPSGDLSRFVQPGTGCVEARLMFSKVGLARGIQAFVDRMVWSVL